MFLKIVSLGSLLMINKFRIVLLSKMHMFSYASMYYIKVFNSYQHKSDLNTCNKEFIWLRKMV